MPNYFIIGGDGKEYGPITEADIRLWLSEGRLNAQTSARTDADTAWRPLGTFPEFAAQSQTPPTIAPPGSAPGTFASSSDYLERDYEIDVGGCVSQGWSLLAGNFGTLFLACLICFAVQGGFDFVTGLIITPVINSLRNTPAGVQMGIGCLRVFVDCLATGPLIGGVYYVFLRVIRRQATGVGDVFMGYQKAFGQLYLASVMIALVLTACFLPFNYVWLTKSGAFMGLLHQFQNDPSMSALQDLMAQFFTTLAACGPVLFICFLPATFFSVCWLFTVPLVIDKQLSFCEAMKTSWKKVMKHWWQVFGLLVLSGLVSDAGFLACVIGILFTAPIGIAALMLGYETIFGERKD